MIPYKESQTPLYNALKEMNTLTKISFKGFCNDELCRIISSYINLTEIKIISLLVTDIGMEVFSIHNNDFSIFQKVARD